MSDSTAKQEQSSTALPPSSALVHLDSELTVTSSDNIKKSDKKCNYCHKKGHLEQECYKKRDANQQTNVNKASTSSARLFYGSTADELKHKRDARRFLPVI